MSRKAIIEFRKVANSQTLDVDKYFFDNIIPIYEDSVHTPQERAKILENDILWLLNDMVQADKAIDRSNPDRQQRIPFFNYRDLLQSLILSTADKGIYLSESFVKAYENVDMGAYSFGEFVRNSYSPKWWEVEPQHKPIAASQQQSDGNGGELAGSSNETPPEGNTDDGGGNDDSSGKYIELPTSLQTADERAEKIFTAAYNNGWIKKNESGGYEWVGFGDTNKNGNIKAREMKLAYLCAQTYGYCKAGYYDDPEGINSPPWNELSTFFNVWYRTPHFEQKDLSYFIAKVDRTDKPQRWRKAIDNLIKTAIK